MLRINEFKVENLSSGCVTDNPAPVFSFSMISSEKMFVEKAVLSVNNWMEEFRQQTGIVYNGPKLTPSFTRYLQS